MTRELQPTDITYAQAGELTVRVHGPNGAGKTTLCALFATLLEDAGHTVVHDTTALYPPGGYDDIVNTHKANLAAGATVRPLTVRVVEVEPEIGAHG